MNSNARTWEPIQHPSCWDAHRLREGVVAGPQHRDEQLRLATTHPPGDRSGSSARRSRRTACPRPDGHGASPDRPARPTADTAAELGIPVAVGVGLAGTPCAAAAASHPCAAAPDGPTRIRRDPRHRGRRQRREQRQLQRRIIKLRRQRPTQPGLRGPVQIPVHRRGRDPHRGGDLPLAQPGRMGQTQHFSDLSPVIGARARPTRRSSPTRPACAATYDHAHCRSPGRRNASRTACESAYVRAHVGAREVACNKGARATCDWPSTRNAITCYGI